MAAVLILWLFVAAAAPDRTDPLGQVRRLTALMQHCTTGTALSAGLGRKLPLCNRLHVRATLLLFFSQIKSARMADMRIKAMWTAMLSYA
jgi:hypothetical protein